MQSDIRLALTPINEPLRNDTEIYAGFIFCFKKQIHVQWQIRQSFLNAVRLTGTLCLAQFDTYTLG